MPETAKQRNYVPRANHEWFKTLHELGVLEHVRTISVERYEEARQNDTLLIDERGLGWIVRTLDAEE